MKWTLIILTTVALAGCGADGEPVRPTAASTITVSPSGVHHDLRVAVNQGPVTISLGI